MTNALRNSDMMRLLEDDQQNKNKAKKPKFSTIKINKETKVLFDELVHHHRTKHIDFIEELLVEWCKHKDKEIYEQYLNKELPGQRK